MKENIFITQRATCLLILGDATGIVGEPSGCLDCGRGRWSAGSGKTEEDSSPRDPRVC